MAKKYNEGVPEYLPAHWLPNRWGQDWRVLVNVEGLDIDAAIADKNPEWMVKEAENFWMTPSGCLNSIRSGTPDL